MASGLRELRVWQEAVATAGEVARVARKAVRPETRHLTDLVVRCGAEVPLAVARAHARESPAAQRAGFLVAIEAAAALETGLAVARHAELLPTAACAELAQRASFIARLLTGYIGYLDRVAEADAEAALRRAPAAAPALSEPLDQVDRA